MRRLAISLLLLVTTIMPIVSQTVAFEETLRISAFKPFRSGVYLHVNDALTMNDVEGDGYTINLNEIGDEIMGTVDPEADGTTSSAMNSRVVFSYRVEGADQPTGADHLGYGISIDITPMTNGEYVIPVLYQLGNFNATFPGNAGDENMPSRDGWAVAYTSTDIRNEVSKEGSKAQFNAEWSITKTETQNKDMPLWVTRGAIGMVVDYSAYENAPYGVYKAKVTMELKVL